MSLFSKDLLKNAEDRPALDTLPPGKYVVQVEESTVQETKNRDGRYLKLKFRIVKGEFAKWCVFHNFNFENKNPKAVEIAASQMKQFLTACGIPQEKQEVKGPDQLLGLTCVVKVATEKQQGYDDKTIVKGFLAEGEIDELDKHLGTPTPQPTAAKAKNMFS